MAMSWFNTFSVPKYNLCSGIGLICAFTILEWQLRSKYLDPKKRRDIYYASVLGLFSGFLSAFVFDALVHGRVLRAWQQDFHHLGHLGGLTFLGGLGGGSLFAIAWLKLRHVPVLMAANIITPSIAIGHSIGRVGCYFSGCCYGKVLVIADMRVRVPTSLAEAGFLAILSAILLLRCPLNQRTQTYLFYYGTWRFLIEFVRGDDRGFLLTSLFSPSQILGLLMVAIAALMSSRIRYPPIFGQRNESIKVDPDRGEQR